MPKSAVFENLLEEHFPELHPIARLTEMESKSSQSPQISTFDRVPEVRVRRVRKSLQSGRHLESRKLKRRPQHSCSASSLIARLFHAAHRLPVQFSVRVAE